MLTFLRSLKAGPTASRHEQWLTTSKARTLTLRVKFLGALNFVAATVTFSQD